MEDIDFIYSERMMKWTRFLYFCCRWTDQYLCLLYLLQILYPATTGRNFDEILRVVDSLLLTAKHKVIDFSRTYCNGNFETNECSNMLRSSFHSNSSDVVNTACIEVATPVDWCVGDSVMVQPTVSADEATVLFPSMEKRELPSGKEYLRMTPMPRD